MKRIINLCAIILYAVLVYAQAPQSFNYQAVARDAAGKLIASSSISIRLTIRKNTSSGTMEYQETHSATTNEFGLFSLPVGAGAQIGSAAFGSINWNGGLKFLQVEIDPDGGTNFKNMGASQLLSVPYALYSNSSANGGANALGDLTDVNLTGAANGQVLKWNGTVWAPANDIGGGNGDNWGTQVVQHDTSLSGQGIVGNELKIAQQNATTGEVLKWNGITWAPAADINTTYSGGTGISVAGTTINNTAPDQTVTLTGSGGTSVSGTYPNFTVTSTDAQTLALNGSTLSISNGNNVTLPAGTAYTAGTGINIAGSTISNTAPDQAVTLTGSGGTSVSGTYPNFTVTSTDAQTLALNGSTLSISNGNNVTLPAGTAYTGGTGINIAGSTISNTAPDQAVTLTGGGGTNVSGTYPNFTVTSTDAQTLALNGSTLSISNGNNVTLPAGTVYTAGTGINITGSTISSTGDTDASNDITNSTAAGGDLAGTYPNPTVDGLQGIGVSSVAPVSGQVLKYNGTQWTAASDNNTTYTQGIGISISGTTITNTGDTDASNDITNTTAAGGDLSGTYPNPNVVRLQGDSVSSTPPTSGQVLQWNGTTWTPTTSSATAWTASGNDIYNSNSGNVGIGTTLPSEKLTISDGVIRLTNSANSINWNLGYDANNTFYIDQLGIARRFFITNTGNVGIGIASPSAKLQISHSSAVGNPQLLLYENTNSFARLNFQNSSGKYWTIAGINDNTPANERIYFYNGVTGNVMSITGDGKVGIGTDSPAYPLDISDNISHDFSGPAGSWSFLLPFGGAGTNSGTQTYTYSVSLHASDYIWATGFIAFSDKRIKKDFFISNNQQDLDLIAQLQVTNFRYKDEMQHGSGFNKGFVAQQIQQVFPEAVSEHNDFIPDIFSLPEKVELVDNSLVLTMKFPHGLCNEDEVRLITKFGKKEVKTEMQDDYTFKVSNWESSDTEVFVYGKKVDDFLAVDYDRIYTLNVSATQELIKKVNALEKENTELKTNEAGLRNRLGQLEQTVAKLQTGMAPTQETKASLK